MTGWGAGNIVSNPTPPGPVEELEARGFGTLRARPPVDWQVSATGTYSVGSYRVVFRRHLKGKGADSVSFRPGQTGHVAFAIWDGSAGDRDGKKSVTIWQQLFVSSRPEEQNGELKP